MRPSLRPQHLGHALTIVAAFQSRSSPTRLLSTTSVSGIVYEAPAEKPTVRLFTKAGCTLCDVAKGVLSEAATSQPHTLEAVDITDPEHADWWDKYKYDIPVLHIDDKYWAKHRITLEASLDALALAERSAFEAQKGEPDAARLERKG